MLHEDEQNKQRRTHLRNPELFSPWQKWLNARNQKEGELDAAKYHFCLSDVDWLGCFVQDNFNLVQFFVVEVKTHGAKLSDSQKLMLSTLNAACKAGSGNGTVEHVVTGIDGKKGKRKLYFQGAHLLELSGSTPDDSETITWDKRPIDSDELVHILRFEKSAKSPTDKCHLGRKPA